MAFKILTEKDCDIFANLGGKKRQTLRRMVIELVRLIFNYIYVFCDIFIQKPLNKKNCIVKLSLDVRFV